MARVDGNNVFSKNLHGETGVTDSTDLQLVKDYYRLQILFNQILFQLKPPMTLYSSADFDNFVLSMPNLLTFSGTITDDNTFYYNNEASLLESFTYDENLITNYRSFSSTLINTLTQAITEYYKVKTLETENVALLTYKEILEDRTKLLDYISEIQKTTYLFSAEATYTNNLEIKPWYKEYLERYGAPGDGIFDNDLLTAIIQEMIESGEITDSELIY